MLRRISHARGAQALLLTGALTLTLLASCGGPGGRPALPVPSSPPVVTSANPPTPVPAQPPSASPSATPGTARTGATSPVGGPRPAGGTHPSAKKGISAWYFAGVDGALADARVSWFY